MRLIDMGSFTPAEAGDRRQMEEALSDIILFGDRRLVELGVKAVHDLLQTGSSDLGPLVEELRIDLPCAARARALSCRSRHSRFRSRTRRPRWR